MLKEKTKESGSGTSQREAKWRTVIFAKSGAVIYGRKLWPTREAAAERQMNQIGRMLAGEIDLKDELNPSVVITKETYSWCMQIPVIEP